MSSYLAPTYDHAASLGQNETDAKRENRLNSRDKGYQLPSYVSKARSAVYGRKGDQKPLHTMDAFWKAAERRPSAAKVWLKQLEGIGPSDCLQIFKQVPPQLISNTASKFALKMLELNQQRLFQRDTRE